MQLNAEGFVDRFLFFYRPIEFYTLLKEVKEIRNKVPHLNNVQYGLSFLNNYAVKYGLPLAQAITTLEYFLRRIEEILGKSIEQIIKEYEFAHLANLLDQKILEDFQNELIKLIEDCPVEYKSPIDLNYEKITRLHIAISDFVKDNSSINNRSDINVFSYEVIEQIYEFFDEIINKNKFDEINFICNMIDNLSLDNNTDNILIKYNKISIFINDFMFRKNNIIKFIDKSFDCNIKIIYETSENFPHSKSSQFAENYNINKLAIENYMKFLLDDLRLILEPIDLNSDKKINELFDQKSLDIFKEKAITFIKDYGPGFYDYNMIHKKLMMFKVTNEKSVRNYFYNDFFDIKTPMIKLTRQEKNNKIYILISILISYFQSIIPNNPTQIPNEEIKNVIKYLVEILEINYDESAINSVLNSESAKTLLSKIGKTPIKINEINNFFIEFDQKHSGVMHEPIPKQANLSFQQNLLL